MGIEAGRVFNGYTKAVPQLYIAFFLGKGHDLYPWAVFPVVEGKSRAAAQNGVLSQQGAPV